MLPRLQTLYLEKIRPQLASRYENVMAVPRIKMITLNMGVGLAAQDKKLLDFAFENMQAIAGQKPVITKAKKSIAGFKIREGWPIGCKVNLRKHRMYEFFDRLISVAIPRIRDFRGLPPRFDGRGNYSFGISEQIVFPEIEYEKIDKIRGLDVIITTSAQTDEEAYLLLKSFEFPFKAKGKERVEHGEEV